MEKPIYSSEFFYSLKTKEEKAAYMVAHAQMQLDYENWLLEQNPRTPEQQEAWERMVKHFGRKMESAGQPIVTVEKDKNNRTIIKTNGIITGAQG